MGRKPNALILEFFERGSKLADQSNRYQHTCKRCGDFFPKGRPDSLVRHLYDKCPNITPEDRARVSARRQEEGNIFSTSRGPRSLDPTNGQLESALLVQREPSALDTLAEVSRQHLDLSRQRSQPGGQGQVQGQGQGQGPGQETDYTGNDMNLLYVQLQQSINNHEASSQDNPYPLPPGPSGQHDNSYALPPGTSSQLDDSPLVQTASAANALEDFLAHQPDDAPPADSGQEAPSPRQASPSQLDPQLQSNQQFPTQPGSVMLPDMPAQFPSTYSALLPRQGQTSPPNGFGLLQRPGRKNARNRFTDDRRKEVQSVRKLGACIRCRMLKKPCSQGTPCSTCRGIEAARLWKNSCIRTRVADEFDLYTTALFHAKSQVKTHSAISDKTLEKVPGRVEATLFPDTNICATFHCMTTRGKASHVNDIDPMLKGQKNQHGVFMLDLDADDAVGKLEKYLVDMTGQCIAKESSSFFKATLSTATELIGQNGDVLLTRCINLWTATNVLAFSSEPRWTLSYVSGLSPEREPVVADDEHDRIPIDPSSTSYDLIMAQLLDATERYCAKQGKAVMNELERRLLQRQQSSAFMTFLVSVILLNCVERMSLLYHSFDTTSPQDLQGLQRHESEDVTATTDQATDALSFIDPGHGHDKDDSKSQFTSPAEDHHHQNPSTSRPADWPLDNPPAHYWRQGPSFADLLALLLRMRGLPPRTTARDDGTLAVLNTAKGPAAFALEVPTAGSAVQGCDPQLVMAARWIEATGVGVGELFAAVRDGAGGEVDGRGLEMLDGGVGGARTGSGTDWDMRFVAGLLLPA